MPYSLFKNGVNLLLRRQTNILSAALIIMVTVVFSQILGLVRQRLLVSIFGASDILGIYLVSSKLPDFLFQLIIAGALSSAFIPVFSEHIGKGKVAQANALGSSLITLGLAVFFVLAFFLFIFAEFFLNLIAPGFSHNQIQLMASLMKIIIFGEILFIFGSFLSAILQSYNHFFIPGIAAAFYNMGMIISIVILSPMVGIFAPAYGVVLGALIFILIQLPMSKKVGFSFVPSFYFKAEGVLETLRLMWPRTLSIAIFYLGTLAIVTLISLLSSPGRNYVIFDYAQTLAFAPIVLFGQTIAQAAFPVLSRERERIEEFKQVFITSFNQMLYLVLPISALLLVLRIPIVRLVYGASQFDWQATVLTGRTLAFFSISIFAQALIYLVSRGFYALHDTKTPLLVGVITTGLMIAMGILFIVYYKLGVETLAIAYSIGSILNLLLLFLILDKRIGGFQKRELLFSQGKIFLATIFTGFALYIPIKLLDQLVFDTTRTVNLILLTGISSFAGLSLYLFLTWLFNVKEAKTFILLFKRIGDWREILGKSEEVIDGTRLKP
ncbi:MAG: murein biosynthesis integral membrane protein MurJ [bacterium]|nr:murein biosynthesis integral membrane protein MurJ [bacterium]